MNQLIRVIVPTVTLCLFSVSAQVATAQPDDQTTTTVVTSKGTITEMDPDAIIVRTDSSSSPIRYTSTKTTTYVDENGNPVSIKTIKSGRPVTIYYDKTGDQMVAQKVIVRKTVTTKTTNY